MRYLLIAGITGLLTAQPCLAQTTVFGTVNDQTGSLLPGVVVELHRSGATQETTTDTTGRYMFGAVTAGPVS